MKLPLISFCSRLLDPLVIVGCLMLAAGMADVDFTGRYFVLALLAFFISSQVFEELDLSKWWLSARYDLDSRNLLIGWCIVVGILLFLGYASKLSSDYSRRVLLGWFVVTPVALFACHVFAKEALTRLRLRGSVRNVVIVGSNEQSLRLAKKINDDPYLFMEVKGVFDDRTRERLDNVEDQPLLGQLANIRDYLKREHIHVIYITLPMTAQPRIKKLLEELGNTTASIYFVPDVFMFELIQARVDDIYGIPVIAICESPFIGINGVIKRLSDFLLASIILLLISPLMLAIAAGVKLSSPGPAIFRQRRYGLDGQEIVVYKFRSMTVCEDGGDLRQATRCDSRLTRFGAFLRRTSLDELPQFINVLQGRMSIVGPRPHAVAHNEQYRKLIRGYMIRHKVRPGITGWAQVNGFRGETESLDKMEARVQYDLDYLRRWSLPLDLMIIFRTARGIFNDQKAY